MEWYYVWLPWLTSKHVSRVCQHQLSFLFKQKISKQVSKQAVGGRAAATICLRPSCKLTISSYLFARWCLFRHVGYSWHQQQVDLWPFDLESAVRVTCDVGYLCANFSLPRPLCSQLRPNVHDRQSVRRQTASSLNAPWYHFCHTVVTSEPLAACRISVRWKPEWIKKFKSRLKNRQRVADENCLWQRVADRRRWTSETTPDCCMCL